MQEGIASIPLDTEQMMRVGYIMHDERRPTPLLDRYITELKRIIADYPGVEVAEDVGA